MLEILLRRWPTLSLSLRKSILSNAWNKPTGIDLLDRYPNVCLSSPSLSDLSHYAAFLARNQRPASGYGVTCDKLCTPRDHGSGLHHCKLTTVPSETRAFRMCRGCYLCLVEEKQLSSYFALGATYGWLLWVPGSKSAPASIHYRSAAELGGAFEAA